MEVIVFGGGEIYRDVFSAIALMAGTNGITSLIRLVMLLGLMMGLLKAMTDFNVGQILKWFVMATIIYGVIWVPKVTVHITDRTNSSIAGADIANVPLGVGWIAGVTSTAGARVIDLTETAFSEPSDARYSKNGMIFGARLMESMASVSSADVRFDQNLQQFYNDCIFYDVSTGYYTAQQLAVQDNLWNYITVTQPTNPARSATYLAADNTTSVIPCNTMATKLDADFSGAIDKTMASWAKKLNPNLPLSTTDAALKNLLSTQLDVAQLMTGNANTALDTVKQVMAVNAMRRGISSFSAQASGDAMHNFVEAQQEVHTRNSQNGLARAAQKAIPLMKIAVEVLFIGMFPVLFPAFLLPAIGPGMLKGYFGGFLYLQLWGPMYVILHKVAMVAATAQTQAAGYLPGSGVGIRLSTIDAMSSVNADIASTAGAMTMMIPVLAAGLTKGAMVVGQQGEALLGQFRGGAEAAASVKSTGNLSVGNTAFENHSFNNVSANRRVSSPFTDTSGNWTNVGESGTTSVRNANGDLVSVQAARSSSGVELNLTRGISQARAHEAQVRAEDGEALRHSVQEGRSTASTQARETVDAWSKGTLTSSTMTDEQRRQVGAMVQTLDSQAESLSKQKGWSNETAKAVVARAAVEATASYENKVGLPVVGEAKVGASIKAGAERSTTWSGRKSNSMTEQQQASFQKSWSERVDESAARSAQDSFSQTRGRSLTTSERNSDSVTTTTGMMDTAEKYSNQSRALVERADRSQTLSAAAQSNLNNEWNTYALGKLVGSQDHQPGGGMIGRERAEGILAARNEGDRLRLEGLAQDFQRDFVMKELKDDPLFAEVGAPGAAVRRQSFEGEPRPLQDQTLARGAPTQGGGGSAQGENGPSFDRVAPTGEGGSGRTGGGAGARAHVGSDAREGSGAGWTDESGQSQSTAAWGRSAGVDGTSRSGSGEVVAGDRNSNLNTIGYGEQGAGSRASGVGTESSAREALNRPVGGEDQGDVGGGYDQTRAGGRGLGQTGPLDANGGDDRATVYRGGQSERRLEQPRDEEIAQAPATPGASTRAGSGLSARLTENGEEGAIGPSAAEAGVRGRRATENGTGDRTTADAMGRPASVGVGEASTAAGGGRGGRGGATSAQAGQPDNNEPASGRDETAAAARVSRESRTDAEEVAGQAPGRRSARRDAGEAGPGHGSDERGSGQRQQERAPAGGERDVESPRAQRAPKAAEGGRGRSDGAARREPAHVAADSADSRRAFLDGTSLRGGLSADLPEGFRDEARGEIQSRLATARRDLNATREADGNLLIHGEPKFDQMPDISDAQQRAGARRLRKRED